MGSVVLANMLGVQLTAFQRGGGCGAGCTKGTDEASRDKFSVELVEDTGRVVSF
jgi:hypothetical protein